MQPSLGGVSMARPSCMLYCINSLHRYGTTTCAVAAMQNNSGNILAVEPDHVVWAAAEVRESAY